MRSQNSQKSFQPSNASRNLGPTIFTRMRTIFCLAILLSTGLSNAPAIAASADDNALRKAVEPLLGRWDLTVTDGVQTYPSWLEISLSGHRTLVGSYVGQFGSARPVSKIDFDLRTAKFRFTVPPQWEARTNDVVVEGALEANKLSGRILNDVGQFIPFRGERAPRLVRATPPTWGKPIELFNGKDLIGWKPRHTNSKHGWVVEDGLLVNAKPGVDLMTEQKFTDFKLRAEFRYPKGSNSGLYLRGRYEVQIEDNFGRQPESHLVGGVYGFLTPRVNSAKPAGEWQTMEITLVGRVVTIILNDEAIIERQTIPGPTGGALDSDEAAPGPLLIQGDHGKVEFKSLMLTPAD
jgi:hypothetical protein